MVLDHLLFFAKLIILKIKKFEGVDAHGNTKYQKEYSNP